MLKDLRQETAYQTRQLEEQSRTLDDRLDVVYEYFGDHAELLRQLLVAKQQTNQQLKCLQGSVENLDRNLGGLVFLGFIGALAYHTKKEKEAEQKRLEEFLKDNEFAIEKQINALLCNSSELRKLVVKHVIKTRMKGFIKKRAKETRICRSEEAMNAMQCAVLGQSRKIDLTLAAARQEEIDECVKDAHRYKRSIESEIEEEVEWMLSKEEKTAELVQATVMLKFVNKYQEEKG